MTLLDIVAIQAGVITGFICVVYIFASIRKDAGIMDVAWGFVQCAVALALMLLVDGYTAIRVLVTLYVVLWGARLSWHIGSRNLRESKEDKRYGAFRKEWGETYWWRSILQIYVLQGVLAFVMSIPLAVATYAGHVGLLESAAQGSFVVIGSLIWWYGFIFESVGDWQLREFLKHKQKGEIMTSGLWEYTRHPNYFGEVTLWWGVWVMLFGVTGFWWALAAPVLITILILRVSGITMLEKRYEGNVAYDAYKKKTSAFFPLPSKR